jgi:hypothetical protein
MDKVGLTPGWTHEIITLGPTIKNIIETINIKTNIINRKIFNHQTYNHRYKE